CRDTGSKCRGSHSSDTRNYGAEHRGEHHWHEHCQKDDAHRSDGGLEVLLNRVLWHGVQIGRTGDHHYRGDYRGHDKPIKSVEQPVGSLAYPRDESYRQYHRQAPYYRGSHHYAHGADDEHREEYHRGHERPEHRRHQVVERLREALVVANHGVSNIREYFAHVDFGAYAAQL